MNTSNLKICGYNCKGYVSSAHYVDKLIDEYDIVFLSEHHLYANNLNKIDQSRKDICVFARPSCKLRDNMIYTGFGYGGIAFIWKKKINQCVRIMSRYGNDRIMAMEIINGSRKLQVIGVYLPQQSCQIADFHEQLILLSDVCQKMKEGGPIIILGDTNCHIGREYSQRSWGKTTFNAHALIDFCSRESMSVIDLNDNTMGPSYTFHAPK